jgi:hypothetical protein
MTQILFYGLSLLALGLLIRLYILSVPAASDFEVYWYAIHAWMKGQDPYAQYSPVFRGLVFKYPPWILPFFLPFAWMSLSASKVIWTTAQVAAIFYSVRWLIKKNISPLLVLVVTLLYWWIWLAHAYFGQIMVFLLAAALYVDSSPPSDSKSVRSDLKLLLLSTLLTSKIFSLLTLLGVTRRVCRLKFLGLSCSFFIFLHLILYFTCNPRSLLPIEDAPTLFYNLYSQFFHAAFSGGSELGATIVRGQQNHGFVALILRILSIDASLAQYDVLVAILLSLVLGTLWHFSSKNLETPSERWLGWMSLGVICHPLAWHHSFVMAFPLCVFSLHKAWRSKNLFLIFSSVLGISCIGLFIPQVIGVDAVIPLEYYASKSWGVVICAVVLVLTSKKNIETRSTPFY